MKRKVIINGVAAEAMSEEDVKELLAILQKLAGTPKEEVEEAPSCLDHYLVKLADRYGWKPEKMVGFLNKISDHHPILAFQMVLKEIAIELDKKYDGHIRNSEHIWIISTANGKVYETPKESIVSYKNFAAFRTEEDANFAIKVLKPQYDALFRGK